MLLQTAFLPRVTASMARALTGQPTAGETLAALHKQNYFTNKQAGDGEPCTGTIPSSASSSCRRRCGFTPRGRASMPYGGRLLDAAGRVEGEPGCCATPWTGRGSPSWSTATRRACWRKAEARPWEEWLHGVPAAIFAEQPWLLFWRGWMGWRHADCQRDLEDGVHGVPPQGDTIGMFLAWAGVIFAYVSEGELVSMDRWIALLDEIVPNARVPLERRRDASGGRHARRLDLAAAAPSRAASGPSGPSRGRGAPRPGTRAIAAVPASPSGAGRHLATAAAVVDEMRAVMRARDVSPVAAVNASMTVVWYEATWLCRPTATR